MESFVKIAWDETPSGWTAKLLTETEQGFQSRDLEPGITIEIDPQNETRCVGYSLGVGRMPCPGFRRIENGSQCFECREHDLLEQYRDGKLSLDTNEMFSVSAIQVGSQVKAAIAPTSEVNKSWLEEGADYAVELFGGLTAKEAVREVETLAEHGFLIEFTEYDPLLDPAEKKVLGDALRTLGPRVARIRTPQDGSIYPALGCSTVSSIESISGEFKAAKGQILAIGGDCFRIPPGTMMTISVDHR